MIVFLTGGTGSFGQGFVKLLLQQPDVEMIRVYSRDEHKQRAMREEFKSDRISFYIGDIRDIYRLRRALDGATHVVHAAALKQAPLGEIEPYEFIKTNVHGTSNVIESCLSEGVERSLLISSDKAVEPINLYGATKMCAEKLFLQSDVMRGTKRTRFSVVRYGNVAGTNGSIIPKLLALRGDVPSPVYDAEATRFWITLEEANQFVLDSLKTMEGGEICIPSMPSVKVMDIIEAIRPGKTVALLPKRIGDKTHEIVSLNPRMVSNDNKFLTVQEIRDSIFNSLG